LRPSDVGANVVVRLQDGTLVAGTLLSYSEGVLVVRVEERGAPQRIPIEEVEEIRVQREAKVAQFLVTVLMLGAVACIVMIEVLSNSSENL